MSNLTDFAKAGFASARSVIGGEIFSISGGTSLSAVVAEEDYERDYEVGGFGESQSLAMECDSAEFQAAYTANAETYLGLLCSARSRSWRVKLIRVGQVTTRIELTATTSSG